MRGFLFSCPPAAGQGHSRFSGTVLVAYEEFATGILVSWPPMTGRQRVPVRFRVVIVYEDFVTGQRARRACRSLAAEVGVSFDQEMWRCDVLHHPELQGRATREVADADLLVLSVHRNLPAGTAALLKAWLAGKPHRESALVAMLDGATAPAEPRDASAPIRLARLARLHGLSFVRERVDGPDDVQRGSLELVWLF